MTIACSIRFSLSTTYKIHIVRNRLQIMICIPTTTHCYTDNNDNNNIRSSLAHTPEIYGVPFSHLFTELQISAIDLQISPNEL